MAVPPDENATPKLLNVYEQAHRHDPLLIVGNEEGLLALREAIDRAIANVQSGDGSEVAYASDGAGFRIFVQKRPSAWSSGYWRRLPTPYTAALCRDGRTEVQDPFEPSDDRRRRLRYDRVRATLNRETDE